jgi:outer membrane protein assembly factor BamE (lipoprotein component of BamABCDE complex)
MTLRVKVVIVAMGTLVACSSVQVGNDFDPREFESKVQRGHTTQGQVRGWLGAPAATGVSVDTGGERFEEWTYYYARGKLPNMPDLEVKILQIKFDRHGIVRGYNWSGP